MNLAKHRNFILLSTALLFALWLPVQAQQPVRISRIGYLSTTDSSYESARANALRSALRELGYLEGQNIGIEFRYAGGKLGKYPELAADLVRLNVDIIVAAGGSAMVRAAKRATKTIPIVMAGTAPDPVKAGLVESLARPGGNVTGITILAGELTGKRLELLKEAFPKVVRVAVLYDPSSPSGALDVKQILPETARALGITIQPCEIGSAEDFDKVFAGLNKERPDALYVSPVALMSANQNRTISFALKTRLPSIYSTREAVDAGGLMSYSADLTESYRRVATYIDRIIKGAKPADLPVEQPTKFELVINLKTAKQIGLTIPLNVLARADRVIK